MRHFCLSTAPRRSKNQEINFGFEANVIIAIIHKILLQFYIRIILDILLTILQTVENDLSSLFMGALENVFLSFKP